jgi:hypothetical protein
VPHGSGFSSVVGEYSREGIVPFERRVHTYTCEGNIASTGLLGKPLKGFIVNPADLSRKWVKRLAASCERVNHDFRVKMYNLCRVLKTVITAVLTDTSGPKNSQNRGLLLLMINSKIKCCLL